MVAQCVRLAHGQRPVEHEVQVEKARYAGLTGAQCMVLYDLLAMSIEDLPDALEFIRRQAGIHQSADGPAGDVNPDPQDMERHDCADQRIEPLESRETNQRNTQEDRHRGKHVSLQMPRIRFQRDRVRVARDTHQQASGKIVGHGCCRKDDKPGVQ